MVQYLEQVLKRDFTSGWRRTGEKVRAFFERTSEVGPKEKTEEMDWKDKAGKNWYYQTSPHWFKQGTAALQFGTKGVVPAARWEMGSLEGGYDVTLCRKCFEVRSCIQTEVRVRKIEYAL